MDDPRIEIRVLRNLLAQMTQAYDEKLKELRREKELIEFTMSSISEGLIVLDEEGNVILINPSVEHLLGIEGSSILHKPVKDVLPLFQYENYQSVPFPVDVCRKKIMNQRTYHRDDLLLKRADGRIIPIRLSAAIIRGDSGETLGCVIVIQDISQERLAQLQLTHHATHDALTGLLNRTAFTKILEDTLKQQINDFKPLALCYLDLDQFKLINDTCGHIAGDELLRHIARILEERVKPGDVVARLGGDEFAILLTNCPEESIVSQLQNIMDGIRQYRFRWHGEFFSVTASAGVVPIRESMEFSYVELLSAADHACYVAKEKGRDRIQLYHHEDETFARRHGEMRWILRLKNNLENNRFNLFAQPILPLAMNKQGMLIEILIRMEDPVGNLHLPSDFIQAAERYGLMKSIDQWVIQQTFKWLNQTALLENPIIQGISINLSRLSLMDPDFLDQVEMFAKKSGISPSKICFEITETAAIQQFERTIESILRLRKLGFRIALDDFGSGMSSYPYLREIPLDFIKIDGSFIRGMMSNYLDRTLVESINQIAHLQGIHTIAEYVNNPHVLEVLQEIGVDYIQGNWVCEPLPLDVLPSRIVNLSQSISHY